MTMPAHHPMDAATDADGGGLFDGPGEMRARCRAFDWSATALGPVSEWSQSLRTTVTTMLASRHPMFLWWGPELVQIFNDGYLPSFGSSGRDRSALGATGREHWAEIWSVIGPQIEGVLSRGEATWHEDQLVPIERNGRVEDVYWTYGYSPVRDDNGAIAGVLVVVQETTTRVQALAERDRLLDAERRARAAAETLRAQAERERAHISELFRSAPAFIAVLRGPSLVFELVNDAYYQLVGHRELLGKPVFDALPEVRGQGFEELLRGVIDSGQPFFGREVPLSIVRTPNAPPEQRYVTFVYAPLGDRDGDRSGVFAHGVDVTDQVLARKAIEAARDEAELSRANAANLLSLSMALSTASTPDQVASAVVALAGPVFGAEGVVIALLSPRGDYVEIVRVEGMSDDLRDAWRVIPIAAPVPLADVARSAEPLFLHSREEWLVSYPDLEEALVASGHHANAVAPLIVHGRVLGVMGAAFTTPQSFGEQERTLVLTVAAQCAQALERSRLYEAERAARQEAELANRIKSDFLTVMSHELRTPLNAIGGYAELLELGIRGPVTPQQAEDLHRIQQSQRHLLGLINEVLNYARVEAGTVRYALERVPVAETISACEALTAPQVRAKGLTTRFLKGAEALHARADREKLQQILLNLLTNAIKFTPRGGHVEVSCAADGKRLHITVADSGRGIETNQLDRIFEPFVQIDPSLTGTQEGVGLGLAISRDLARGMGGELTAKSTFGKGSAFTLTLPLD